MKINIKMPTGQFMVVEVEPHVTLLALREELRKQGSINTIMRISNADIGFIFNGKPLTDTEWTKSLSECGIVPESNLEVVLTRQASIYVRMLESPRLGGIIQTIPITVYPDTTVSKVKEQLKKEHFSNAKDIKLARAGVTLEDNQNLYSRGEDEFGAIVSFDLAPQQIIGSKKVLEESKEETKENKKGDEKTEVHPKQQDSQTSVKFYNHVIPKRVNCLILGDTPIRPDSYESITINNHLTHLSLNSVKNEQHAATHIVNQDFQMANVILILVDLGDRNSFEKIDQHVKQAREKARKNTPIILIAKSSDITDQKITETELRNKAIEIGAFDCIKTSKDNNEVGYTNLCRRAVQAALPELDDKGPTLQEQVDTYTSWGNQFLAVLKFIFSFFIRSLSLEKQTLAEQFKAELVQGNGKLTSERVEFYQHHNRQLVKGHYEYHAPIFQDRYGKNEMGTLVLNEGEFGKILDHAAKKAHSLSLL